MAILFLIAGTLICAELTTAKEEKQAMETVIRLHVRAENNTEEEQALKLRVRNEILHCTQTILSQCSDRKEAREILMQNLPLLESVGQKAVVDAGKEHEVSVTLQREEFGYREYEGFFLPAGEYESLIVTIGSGEGENWWCVVFPAACTMGAAEEPETNAEAMPNCFRLATARSKTVRVKFRIWEEIKKIFS